MLRNYSDLLIGILAVNNASMFALRNMTQDPFNAQERCQHLASVGIACAQVDDSLK